MPGPRPEKAAHIAPDETSPIAPTQQHTLRSKASHTSLGHQPLLVVQGSAALAGWQVVASTGRPTPQEQLMHHTRRFYDRGLLGFCYVVDSLSVSLSYKASNPSIIHPLLAVQIFVPHDCKKLSIELGMSDVMKSNQSKIFSKRRFFMSTAIKEVKSTPLHASLPLKSILPRNEWTTLLFDLNSIVASAYRNCRFRSLEAISIQGDKVKLRNIYTLRSLATTSADEAAPSSSRSSTSLSLSTVSSTCDLVEFPSGMSASQLDSIAPRQLAYPFTMTSNTSWVVVRGGPESCQHLQSQPMLESSLRPGQLKKADSGLSISLSPSVSLASLSASTYGMLEPHQQVSEAYDPPLEVPSLLKTAPIDPSLMSMVDRVRRRKAALDRINELSSLAPAQPPPQQQPQGHQGHHAQRHSRTEQRHQHPQPSTFVQQLPVFPSGIPRPTGGFTGRGPILTPIARPTLTAKHEAAAAVEINAVAVVDPYDLEVQQAVERAMRKVQIHSAGSLPVEAAPVQRCVVGVGTKGPIRTDSGAKSKTPSEAGDRVLSGSATGGATVHERGLPRNDDALAFATKEQPGNDEFAEVAVDGGDEEDSIELVYDAAVGAYFDPQTNKYFTVQD